MSRGKSAMAFSFMSPDTMLILPSGLVAASFVLAPRRVGRIVFVVTLGLAVCGATFLLWRSHRFEKGYDQIEIGVSQESVRALLGKPALITDCTKTFGGYRRGDSEPIPLGCAEEYWYHSSFFPEAWSVGFDKDKRVIDKYHWVSA
jgi:hypothetical protein